MQLSAGCEAERKAVHRAFHYSAHRKHKVYDIRQPGVTLIYSHQMAWQLEMISHWRSYWRIQWVKYDMLMSDWLLWHHNILVYKVNELVSRSFSVLKKVSSNWQLSLSVGINSGNDFMQCFGNNDLLNY